MKLTTKFKQRLLTVSVVAEICGVAPATIRRMTDSGAMPLPVRLGRAVRYRRDDIMDWIDDGCPDLSKLGRRPNIDLPPSSTPVNRNRLQLFQSVLKLANLTWSIIQWLCLNR